MNFSDTDYKMEDSFIIKLTVNSKIINTSFQKDIMSLIWIYEKVFVLKKKNIWFCNKM